MATSVIKSIKFCGLSACVPKQVHKISDYKYFSEEEAKRFTKQTGVVQRRIAPSSLCASDMCFESAQKLISKLDWNKEDIEIIIFVSQSPDYLRPATACILQDRLGLKKTCLAFDINLGCSGYVYALTTIASMMSAMKLKKGLLLAGENVLLNVDEKDKGYYPLFGDAGTASAFSYDQNAADIFVDLNTDGSGFEKIILKTGGARNPYRYENIKPYLKDEESLKEFLYSAVLDGPNIFDFCLREVKPSIVKLLNFADKTVDDIDYLFAHQANKLINETVRKMCKFPLEKHPYCIDEFANTSVSSIPLTMIAKAKNDLSSKKSMNLLAGFGIGFSWASVLIETDKLVCTDLLEI